MLAEPPPCPLLSPLLWWLLIPCNHDCCRAPARAPPPALCLSRCQPRDRETLTFD